MFNEVEAISGKVCRKLVWVFDGVTSGCSAPRRSEIWNMWVSEVLCVTRRFKPFPKSYSYWYPITVSIFSTKELPMEAKEFSEKALLFFAKSKYADLFGVALVITIAIASGYLSTNLAKYVDWGPITPFIPLGVISVINVGISMMSTRLTGRLSNIGNVLGIINTALSGAIDYILGNKAAIITYPVTFIVYTFAIRRWQNSERGKAMEPPTGAKGQLIISSIVVGSFAFSLAANYIGYGGQTSFLFWITTAVFGLSLSANILNALKLTMQWQFWFVYNAVQCMKALTQGNFANVGKYIFYIINSVAALLLWTRSGTAAKGTVAVA